MEALHRCLILTETSYMQAILPFCLIILAEGKLAMKTYELVQHHVLICREYLGWFIDLWHKISGNLDVLGKNRLHIRIQQEKSYQNDELFFLGFEKFIKMQASVI